jgi:hypothetical protein
VRVLMVFVAMVSAATAGPLTPQWDGVEARYHLELALHTRNPIRYYSPRNDDARVVDHLVALDTVCRASPDRKGWMATCELDDVRLGGIAYPGEQEKLDGILAEWAAILEQSHVQLNLAADGRIVGLDLEGPSKADERQAAIHETMRLLMRRVFTVMDVQSPKGGALPTGSWKQKGSPLAFELFTATGTAGGMAMRHTPGTATPTSLSFETSGRGNVSTGANLDANAGSMVNLVLGANGRFDLDSGLLAWRELSLSGELAGELRAADESAYWSLDAWVGRVRADGTVETRGGPVAR